MADGVLGIGGGGSAALNQETIDKLKAAEKKGQVDPIEKDIENYDLATVKVDEIEQKVLDLLESVRTFDLFNSTGTNTFDVMSASTTGTAATFEALDSATLSPGTVSVTVSQLAQKDAYQSSTFSDASVQVSGGNDSGDMLVLSQSDRPVYQSDNTTTAPSSDIVDASGGTIILDGTTFTVTSTMTYDELNTLINADSTYSSQIINDRLSIKNADGTTAVTVTGTTSTTIGLTQGEKYTTEGKTYADLATSINNNPDYAASVEQVGDSSYRFVVKSTDSGTANAISISQIGVDLDLSDSFTSATTFTSTDSVSGSIVINGTTFTNDGSAGQTTYQDIVDQINADGNFTASFSSNKIIVSTADGLTAVDITSDTLNLGLADDSQALKAQNFNGVIDGVSYDVSSNNVNTQGNLNVTAVEEGTSTISIKRDTSSVLTNTETMVAKYNELLELIDEENFSADSPISDMGSFRTMMGQIKDLLFADYGTSDDKNLFSYGFELDKDGKLSINATTFATAISDDFDGLKELFVGVAEDKGLGTVLKEYIDDLNGFDGLLSLYDESRISRKETLDKDLVSATEKLDTKYDYLAQQFASYGTAIAALEASFGGLKMMIEQSVAG